MKKANKYSSNYICHITNNKDGLAFIADCRKVLRGSGFGVTAYARNPNRRQFYPDKSQRTYTNSGYVAKHDFCQNLPRQFATSFALYFSTSASPRSITMERAHGRVDTVRKIYETNNIKLTA